MVRSPNNVAPLQRYARLPRRGDHFPEISNISQKRQRWKMAPLCGDMLTFSGALKTDNSRTAKYTPEVPRGPPSSPPGGLWPKSYRFVLNVYLKSTNFDSQRPPADHPHHLLAASGPKSYRFALKVYLKSSNFDSQRPPAQIALITSWPKILPFSNASLSKIDQF